MSAPHPTYEQLVDLPAHALVYLLNDTHEQLSFVMEEIFLDIDMETRRNSPLAGRRRGWSRPAHRRRRGSAVEGRRVRFDAPALRNGPTPTPADVTTRTPPAS